MASILKLSPELRYCPRVVFPEEDKAFLGRYVKYRRRRSRGALRPARGAQARRPRVRHKAVPDFVTVHARPAVCPEARALIEEFEPGVHQFLPVEVVRAARSKKPIHRLDGRVLDAPYHLFIPQTILDAVWVERSAVRVNPTYLGPPLVVPRYVGSYDDIVLRRELTEGRHVWRGSFHLPERIFFSDALVRAVDERKLRRLEWIHLEEA